MTMNSLLREESQTNGREYILRATRLVILKYYCKVKEKGFEYKIKCKS